jgi:hypothetical protein
MPFGLKNYLSTFMRMMEDILRPFTNTFVVVYLDNIFIYNKTWAEHLQYIQQVMHTLQQHQLYANLEKCSFGMDKVHYLGYIVDQHDIHVDLAKIEVIYDWSAPTTLAELQNFLGLANFYCRFVLELSHIAWALIQVTRGGGKEKFVWGRSQQQAFDDLKHACAQLQYFHYRTYNNPLISRQILQTMLWVSFSLNMTTRWPIILRHYQTLSVSTLLMTKKCTPL